MNNKGTVILETERLILRRFTLEDAEEIFKNWGSDDEVTKYVRWSTHNTIEDTKEYLESVMEKYRNNEFEWALSLKDTGELIGAMTAFVSEDDRYELGYNTARRHWRKGYTTEALRAVMNYLINEVGIRRFRCSHAKLNPASGAVMQKVGFKYVKDEFVEKFDKSEKFDTKVYYLDIVDKK